MQSHRFSAHAGTKLAVCALGIAACLAGVGPAGANEPTQLPVKWSFEDDAPGFAYVDRFGSGTNGWFGVADSTNAPAASVVAEPFAYGGTPPLPAKTHSNVLAVVGFVSNVVVKTVVTNVTVDCLIRPGWRTSTPLLDKEPQVAAYVNTNGNLMLRHAYYSGDQGSEFTSVTSLWSEITVNPPVGSNDWTRVTVTLDYLSSTTNAFGDFSEDEHFFQFAVNGGAPIQHPLAYSDPTPEDLGETGRNGTWFLCADSGAPNQAGDNNKWLSSVGVEGLGKLDDLVIDLAINTNATQRTPYEQWVIDNGLEQSDGDWDDDLAPDIDEFEAGTEPKNSNSVFKVFMLTQVGGTNWLTWMGSTNSGVYTKFFVKRMTNLADTAMADWPTVGTDIDRPTGGDTVIWPDTDTPSSRRVFYRPALPR